MPHADPVDWSIEGVTCGPDLECFAWASRTGSPCTSYASVELEAVDGPILLCGRDFGLHRRGVSLRIVR
jgi:hypothetical protein